MKPISRNEWTLKNLEDGGKLSHFPEDIKENMRKECLKKYTEE